ncbi:hypothetical protein [Pedococcus sp. 5OH_020]|uniref:hypothetical protein n=1 Tax=Pedococcus sp. 5OH_020 TaxID=2989814 RepID=UPI0022E9F55D|nr:hypothetical protein [Pedococcus sp. 5OH_020]
MKTLSLRTAVGKSVRVTAVALAVVLGSAAAAQAATVSQSTASAINVAALSTPLIPISKAVDDGSVPQVVSTLSGAIPLLPGETLANTGVYSQTAIASSDGTSAACAGIVGTGGALTLGSDGTCTATTAGPAIVNLPSFSVLGTGYTFRIEASSLYSYCTAATADSTTGFSAGSTLANVKIIAQATVLGIPGPAVVIPIDVNQPASIPAPFSSVLSVAVNQVDTTGPTTSATALHIGLGPNSSILSLDLGKVTCGGNALTQDVPMLPLGGAAVALGTAAVMTGTSYGIRRHRASRAAA